LRNDKDVVLEAVRNDWKALKYISLELQNDNEILLAVSNQLNTEYTIERILQTASEYNTKNIYSVLERLEWEHIKKYLKNW